MERYRLEEAAEALGVGLSTLRIWLAASSALRKAVQKQRLDYDMRRHYLTGDQLRELAEGHGRTLTPRDQATRLEDLEAVDAALTERIEALETRVKALEAALEALKEPS